jgi:hypothetical protein
MTISMTMTTVQTIASLPPGRRLKKNGGERARCSDQPRFVEGYRRASRARDRAVLRPGEDDDPAMIVNVATPNGPASSSILARPAGGGSTSSGPSTAPTAPPITTLEITPALIGRVYFSRGETPRPIPPGPPPSPPSQA